MKTKRNYTVRKATIDDIPRLVSHHRLMVEEIRTLQHRNFSSEQYIKMEEAQTEKLRKDMTSELCHAWIAEDNNGNIAASGAISICSFTASPENPTYMEAYVHSVYTEKEHRGNKLSTRIINEAISFCREKGISKIFLKASDAGKPVYDALGFEPLNTFMHLTV